MAIFAVVGSDQPEKLEAIIKEKFPDQYCNIGIGQWFIYTEKMTTQEAAEAIGIDGNQGKLIVIPVSNYWGFHFNNTWEWLEKRDEK